MNKNREIGNIEQTLRERGGTEEYSIQFTQQSLPCFYWKNLVNKRSQMHTGILQKWKESLYKPRIEISLQERNQHSVKEISLTMINNM